ncbi:PorV/PorQ family protein, partial [Candidatus Desantisbacteria bacterium]|nr:PorV/PorQ family protein [Candidatus Desantisbacteria bacterium]
MIKRVVSVLIILVLSVSFVEAKDLGKSRAAFLKIGVGARAAAMGEAFCGLSDDISAIYWNPAGLSQLTQTEIMTTHHSYFQGINSEYLAFVHPNKNQTAFGASLSMLGINGIKRYDKSNNNLNSNFKADDMVMSLACSKMFGPCAAVGAGLKMVKQGIDDKNTNNLVADLGGLYHTPIHNLVLGATVQNIGINSSSNKKRGALDDQLPFRMRFGASYQWQKSIVCVDVNMPNDGGRTTNLGVEYALPKIARFETMLRIGYRIGADTGKLGFGFGVLSNNCSFDYAFASCGDLGNSQRLSTSLRFGTSKPKHRVALIEPTDTKGGKKVEPLISWLNVQQFAFGLFIEERNFPERLKKKKDDKKKMPVLPGINAPAETAKGTSTAIGAEASEVRKNVDFDKAADEINFDAEEETTDAAVPTPAVPAPNSGNVEKPQGTTTTTSSPQAKAADAAVPTPAASAPNSGNVEKLQGTAADVSPSQAKATDAASDTGKNACATKAVSTGGATSLPQTKTTDAAVDKTTPADVKQG